MPELDDGTPELGEDRGGDFACGRTGVLPVAVLSADQDLRCPFVL